MAEGDAVCLGGNGELFGVDVDVHFHIHIHIDVHIGIAPGAIAVSARRAIVFQTAVLDDVAAFLVSSIVGEIGIIVPFANVGRCGGHVGGVFLAVHMQAVFARI